MHTIFWPLFEFEALFDVFCFMFFMKRSIASSKFSENDTNLLIMKQFMENNSWVYQVRSWVPVCLVYYENMPYLNFDRRSEKFHG